MIKRKAHYLPFLGVILALAPAPAAAAQETAVLAGGCFWGVEAVFEHVKGVKNVVSGYAGGSRSDATYRKVSSERTRHAEAVRITFDNAVLSYDDILRIFFAVAHDPTQLNRQGPDKGPSYRSAIFPQNERQRLSAARMIVNAGRSPRFTKPIVTKIESGAFFPAEAEHQDFMKRNPRHPYILAHDVPKIAALKRVFPNLFRS